MRVPRRKPGALALEKPDYHMTPEAIKELENELQKLQKFVLPKALEEMQHAASHGDFSENAAYQIAKGRVRGLNNKIEQLQQRIARAIPIEIGSADGKIRIGATVIVEVNGKERTYQILGAHETDPATGKISHLSPLGLLLLGHKAGDTVSLDNGEKSVEYKIVDVK